MLVGFFFGICRTVAVDFDGNDIDLESDTEGLFKVIFDAGAVGVEGEGKTSLIGRGLSGLAKKTFRLTGIGDDDLELGNEKKLSANFAPSLMFTFFLPLYLANSNLPKGWISPQLPG